MSALLEKIQSVVASVPIVIGGKKLSPKDAENAIWTRLEDERIGVLRDEPDTHALLSFVSEHDFRIVFCDEDPKMALPSAKALMGQILNQEADAPAPASDGSVVGAIKQLIDVNRPVGQLKTRELLERYDADAPQEIWNELDGRAKHQPFAAFTGTELNVDLTLKILQGIRKGDEYGNTYHDGSKPWRLYGVGKFPEDLAIQCPITGAILSNGYSSKLKVSWQGVDEECMVFVRVVRDRNPGEDFTGRIAAKHMVNVAKQGMEALREEFPDESLAYDDLKAEGRLPSLRVNRNSMVAGRAVESRGTLDPFGTPRRR